MPNPRPSAWALTGVLVASLLLGPAAALPVAAALDTSVCSPDQGPTKWQSDLVPPNTIRVLRTDGPNAGHVETVPFWDYVGVVAKTEYSGSGTTGPVWFRMAGLTVKQYAWYYARVWRGGKVSFTVTNPDGSTTTTTECYDVKDTTADQLYRPVKWDPTLEAWVPRNVATAQHLAGMRDTWHMSLRKWKAKKNFTFMFLTGYRSGLKVPCGADKTGMRMFQKSLRDCVAKGLTFEETLRRYYDPQFIVNSRNHDAVNNSNAFFGELALLTNNSGNVSWKLFPGSPDRFGAAVAGNTSVSFASVVGQGMGDVDGDERADLVMLANDGARLQVGLSNGNKLGALTGTNVSGAAAQRLLVADFNGDFQVDAGLLRSTGAGNASLSVMPGQADGGFGAEAAWWNGALDLSSPGTFVAAGDVNGDGKADLIMRDATGAYLTASSRATCSSFAAWGPCPDAAKGAPGLGEANPAFSASGDVASGKSVVGDFDRDGRTDVLVLVKNGAGSRVVALRSTGNGSFADPQQLWSGSVSFENTTPVAMDVNSDSVADMTLVNTSAGQVTWLRGVERTRVPASMVHMTSARQDAGFTSGRPF